MILCLNVIPLLLYAVSTIAIPSPLLQAESIHPLQACEVALEQSRFFERAHQQGPVWSDWDYYQLSTDQDQELPVEFLEAQNAQSQSSRSAESSTPTGVNEWKSKLLRRRSMMTDSMASTSVPGYKHLESMANLATVVPLPVAQHKQENFLHGQARAAVMRSIRNSKKCLNGE